MATRNSQLSDNQRRFVCRIVFLLLCVLPTSAVVYFVLHRPGPDDWEQTILAQLGIKVEIESVETPTPNTAVIRGITIHDSDSNLAPELDGRTIEELLVVFGNDSSQIIVNESVAIQTKSLSNIIQQCSARLSDALTEKCNWQLGFSKILLVDADTPDFVLHAAKLFLKKNQNNGTNEEDTIQAVLRATVPGQNPEDWVELRVSRIANQNVVEIDTGSGLLPCHLIRHYQTGAHLLGSSSCFNGQVRLSFYDNQWRTMNGRIAGNLDNVQLDLLTVSPGRNFTGRCNIQEFDLQFDEGRIDSARMHIVSDGAVSFNRELIDDATDLFVETSLKLANQEKVSFAKLDMGLFFDHGELTLSGTTDEIIRDGQVVVVDDAIAFDRAGDAVAICNGRLPIPIQQIALLLTGEKSLGNRSIALMDRFKIPTHRTANNQEAVPPYRR